MKLYVFGLRYPALYSPYLDDQYNDLLERGHELTFLADSPFLPGDPTPRQQRLIEHALYYDPSTLRGAVAGIRRAVTALAVGPRRRGRQLAAAQSGPLRMRVRSMLRLLNMPVDAPDACLVNGTRMLLRVPWLKRAYPSATVCYYYHGGGLHGATAMDIFPHVDLVFTNTESSRQRLLEMGCPDPKIRVLPVGFDPARYPLSLRQTYRRDGLLHLVSASRISEEKGHSVALAALALLRDRGFSSFRYTIIGGGRDAEVARVRELVSQYRLEEFVQLAGEMSTSQVTAALGDADALLLPSIRHETHMETQAAVVQEAMLMRTAIIVSDIGGVPECIPPFWKEWCIPSRDPEAVAEAVLRLSAKRVEDLQAETLAAREWTIQHYAVSKLNDRLLGDILHARTAGRLTVTAWRSPPAPLSR